MATKKAAARTPSAKQTGAKASSRAPKSMPKAGKNPKGGLTEAGREYFAKKEGAHLKPGVTGAADTPEKMRRKGSFLRRHFTHPRGPMVDDNGQPTRLALSAHAWGEPVPKTMAAAKKLADKGHKLLEQYHAAQEGTKTGTKAKAKVVRETKAKKAPARKTSAKQSQTKSPTTGTARTKKPAAKKAPGRPAKG